MIYNHICSKISTLCDYFSIKKKLLHFATASILTVL